jgi:hypothetical protein
MSRILCLAAILVCFGVITAFPQACGNIYARFEIRDSQNKEISDAKLELFREESNKFAFYAGDITYSSDAAAFKLRHGLCGSHYRTRLVVRHRMYEEFERLVDLPLNNPRNEHAFIVTLRRKGTTETESFTQLAALAGILEGSNGMAISEVPIALIDVEGKRIEIRTERAGYFAFSVLPGKYSLEVVASDVNSKMRIDLDLGPGPRWQTIKLPQ